MSTLIYSANSHRKIAHLPHCSIIRRIPLNNRLRFENLEEAQAHGYCLCKCCPSIAQKYRKERKSVDSFVKESGMVFKLQDDTIHIISRHDCWRIIVNGRNKRLFLYHKNTERRFRNNDGQSIIPGYHPQSFRADTILSCLKYIRSHDHYRNEHPCTEKITPPKVSTKEEPEWFVEKYGEYHQSYIRQHHKRIRGTKKYKKEQKRKKRQEIRAGIIRVNALLEELSIIGY